MTQIAYGFWDGEVLDNRKGGLGLPADFAEPQNLDTFDDGNAVRAFIGDRGFFVMDEQVSLLDAFRQYLDRAAGQSCGKCTPCRVGTGLIRDALDALCRGEAGALDLDGIAGMARHITDTALCGLGQTCGGALIAAIENFRDVIEAEIAAAPAPRQHGMSYVTAPCMEACPCKINVPRYIDYIKDGRPEYSLGVILQKVPMAATCGRVCVRFCEMACRRNLVDQAVGIKTLKRYVADLQNGPNPLRFASDQIRTPLGPEMRVAVVGAGPAGLSCAYHLLLRGYHVDIFEALPEAGGMAAIGIPSYRLPKHVLKTETETLTALGGRFLFNQEMGRDFTTDSLFADGYLAVFLGLGCQEPALLGVEGENPALPGYESGIGFLLKVHDHLAGISKTELAGDVVVVGGGNVAMDCARSALRMGAANVHLVYRRTREEMPADKAEIEAAEEEGVIFHFLTNPERVLSADGRIAGLTLVEMRTTEPDKKGRMGVEPISGSEREVACSHLIAAIGQQVQAEALAQEELIGLNRWKCVAADPGSLATSRAGVFAGGDCVSGPGTLVQAMSHGLKAARNIDDWIQHGRIRFFPRSRIREMVKENRMLAASDIKIPVLNEYRVHHPELEPEIRKHTFDEVEQTIGQEEAYREASRCLRCYRIYSVVTQQPVPEGAV
ncbi:MAG: FAD-dependent oxidoreductase [Rhodospirillaceae bacterium]